MLAGQPTPPPVANPDVNSDDAPTVITRVQPPSSGSLPLPLAVISDPPSVAGRRLGHYELIEAVGSGGMAAVLKARDLELGRIVALKILPPEAALDPESVNRFKQEARAAARLDHENVARVYSCGEDQGLHYIAFEFVEGETLRALVDRRGPLPADECIGYLIQVAVGLSHAAERGVVHRDIKPSNIIITPDGRAKIVDMGLARHLDSGSVNGGVTQSGVTLGTFDYISPEQALDPRRADVRSDIYSLGCAFYHVLTGQPPVPEGTAAKKLHAHQHENPVDPRDLNPSVPDELATILARMMAKDPEQRYQTPRELIAHLKVLASRLNLVTDVAPSDSANRAVVSTPGALPEPPRPQLGWVLATTAVIIAVAVFAMSTGNPGPRPNPPWANDQPTTKTESSSGLQGLSSPPPLVGGNVRTAEELAAKLADPKTTRIQLAPGLIDLTRLPDPVVFHGQELQLVGSVSPPTTIRLNPGNGRSLQRPGTLNFVGAGSINLSGVWFEVAEPNAGESRPLAAALTVADTTQVNLTDCVFGVPPVASRTVGAVRVTRSGDQLSPQVRVQRCVFARGQFAIWVPNRADVVVSDCGFGPHENALRVDDDPVSTPIFTVPEAPRRDAMIRLERSSFLLEPGTAVFGESLPGGDGPGVRIAAGFCVFAPVSDAFPVPIFGTLAEPRPALIRTPDLPRHVGFSGVPEQKNVYYRIEPLVVTSSDTTRYFTFDDCRVAGLPIEDRGAVIVGERPWNEPEVVAALTGVNPWRAFRLRLTDPAVFVPGEPKVVGAQFHNDQLLPKRRAYPDLNNWPPELPKYPSPNSPRQLVWEPGAAEPLAPGVYSDLAILLRSLRPGDEVLIRHTGLLPVERTELKARAGADPATFRVTFKPFPGSKPVLTAAGGRELNQTLFQVQSGRVTFEGLQFLLKPSRPRDPQQVATVQIVGAEGCTFTDCVFTLAEEDDSKVAAVIIDDPDRVMAMDGVARPIPKVKFERCVIRGKGRGVWVPVSRAIELEATNSLTAIDGPLFLTEPAGKPAPGTRSVLRFTRLTALVGGPVILLKGGNNGEMRTAGLVPVEVHADECLFAGVTGAGQPLVEFDGIDPTDVPTLLEWQVRNANRYANFDDRMAVVVIRMGGDGTTPRMWDWNRWIPFAGEPGNNPVGRVIFPKPPRVGELALVRPSDVTVRDVDFPDLMGAKPTDAGAEPKALPIPFDTDRVPE